MDKVKQTVWLSKYALSAGIAEYRAEIRDDKAYPGHPFSSYIGFKMGSEAHSTREAAVIAANAAVKKKVASLRKQIAKLEATKF